MLTFLPGTKQSKVIQFCFHISRSVIGWNLANQLDSLLSLKKNFELNFDLGLISRLLNRAMEKYQSELFLPAFLLARQITWEKNGAGYGVWFSSITSSSTSSKNFTLLIKFLSSIARYEPAFVLKAHLNNPPHIPMVLA